MALLIVLLCEQSFARCYLYDLGLFLGVRRILAIVLEALPCAGVIVRGLARGTGLACCLVALATLQSYFFSSLKGSLTQPFHAFTDNLVTLARPGPSLRRLHVLLEAARKETHF